MGEMKIGVIGTGMHHPDIDQIISQARANTPPPFDPYIRGNRLFLTGVKVHQFIINRVKRDFNKQTQELLASAIQASKGDCEKIIIDSVGGEQK